jgi:hypothetical protein
VAERGSFDVRALAEATAANTLRVHNMWCRELARWLIAEDIAEPNGKPDRYELTEYGAALGGDESPDGGRSRHGLRLPWKRPQVGPVIGCS